MDFNGGILKTRSYLSKDEYKSRERETYNRNEQGIEGDLKDHSNTDIYGGIEETRTEN